ncbi:flagellar assembly protein FliW [Halalkalibacillus sediminis]|uniref:Flagellar assembly factor FliW n=1 Tax=Halalkalibacillus sediminis TaxID=2018042 RepID=A0A2I0QUI3_9BACI|nr:flagellar assembly protein FliW [Halalkalibacillus sediminis]PKR77986.1 flagellar assembly protein FliW [Halalkalibacillus sediminis]
MNVSTVYFGEVTVDSSKIIQFENGLPGFNDAKEFVLIDIEGNPTFQVLQSIGKEDLAFVVTNPFLIYSNYEFDADDQALEKLKLETNEHLVVKCILTLEKPFEQSTINLKAPIIINAQTRQAKQIVLKEDKFHTKHPIQQGGE